MRASAAAGLVLIFTDSAGLLDGWFAIEKKEKTHVFCLWRYSLRLPGNPRATRRV